MRVHEEPVIKMRYVQARIKPEQVGHVTPGWEPKTALPEEGCVFSRMEVDGMPEPTEVVEINENGDHHVERAGIARVNVQPVLETAIVTPTERQQTVTADHGDGLSSVTIEPIPQEYIVPSGTKLIKQNGMGIDVRGYASADIDVPIPTMPDEYAIGGSLSDETTTGYFIKRGATKIKQYMFQNFQFLESVDIPDSVTEIGNYAFNWVAKPIEIKLPTQLKTIGLSAFQNARKMTLVGKLPEGLESIGGAAFNTCTNLELDEIPDSVTSLGNQAFANCPKITSIKLSQSLSIIPKECFYNSGLLSIDIPSGITELASACFWQSMNLATVTFHGTPNVIATNAFTHCTNLVSIYVPWAEEAVAGAPWGATNATITYNYTGA